MTLAKGRHASGNRFPWAYQTRVIGHESFQLPDAYGLPLDPDHTMLFALVLLGTYPPGNAGESICLFDYFRSLQKFSTSNQFDKFRNPDADRTSQNTFGFFTLQAARSFQPSHCRRISQADLFEVQEVVDETELWQSLFHQHYNWARVEQLGVDICRDDDLRRTGGP